MTEEIDLTIPDFLDRRQKHGQRPAKIEASEKDVREAEGDMFLVRPRRGDPGMQPSQREDDS